uniref:Uncharacterized protein n=1 Tax=Podoviridae sp. ctV3c15 TaxID=2826559 RepID=A0A8S5MST4_9CAUD|nr:MAG TPA: hypothetical protein [Podoviridae sp. ctV3c15]
MTVKELKEELNKAKDSANVLFSYDTGFGIGDVCILEIDKDGDVILSDE